MPTPSGSGTTDPTPTRPAADASRPEPAAEGADGRVLPEPRPGGAGYPAVFAVREFRAVFFAHVLSMLGEVVCGIALSVLVYRVTGSPLLSALAFAFALLPYIIGGTLLSAVADRYPARRVLVVCDLISAVCVAAMVVPGMPVGWLLVLRCVPAAVSPVFSGTRAATLGDILGEGDLFVLGRSVIRLTAQGAQLAGFAAGGLLLAAVSPRAVLAITAASFVGSALVLRLGTRRRPARTDGRGGKLLGDSLGGMRQLFAVPRIRALFLLNWVPPTFVVMSEALMTPYSDGLGLGSTGLGLLMCGMPIGAIVSETLAGTLLGPAGRARLTLVVAVVCMLPSLGYVFEPSFGWALALQVATGCGMAYSLGLDQWFMAAVPEGLRGRAMTVMTAGLMTAQGLGMAVAGAVAELAPLHLVVTAAGVCGTVCSLLAVALVRRGTAGPHVTGGAG